MELTQVGRRILLQHWRLIAVFIVVALNGVVALEISHSPTYTAAARLVLDTPDPTTRQEAAAVADTAQALATSPGQIADALRKAGVRDRDPVAVARDEVKVQSLGSSGLLELTVSDASRQQATTIANALAAQVIQARLDVTQGDARRVMIDLDRRLADVRGRLSGMDVRIAALNAAASGGANGPSARRDAAERARQSLVEQEGVLESERVSLLTADASRPRPAVVSMAKLPAHADPSPLPVHLVLGLLLGLILGVGFAALLETLRPTVVGSDAVAREFGAPLLGSLPAAPDREAALTDPGRVASRLALAAEAARIPSVRLLAAGPEVDLRPLAARLDRVGSHVTEAARVPVVARGGAVADAEGAPGETMPIGRGAIRVDAHTIEVPMTNGHATGGIVVVAPTTLKMADVVDATELLRVVPAPVLGVITYGHARR